MDLHLLQKVFIYNYNDLIFLDNSVDVETGVNFLLQQCESDDDYVRSNSTHAICNFIENNSDKLHYLRREGIDTIIGLLQHDCDEELYYACCTLYKLIKSGCIFMQIFIYFC